MGCDANDSLVSRALARLFWSSSFVLPRGHSENLGGISHCSLFSQTFWHINSGQIHVCVGQDFAQDFLHGFNESLSPAPSSGRSSP